MIIDYIFHDDTRNIDYIFIDDAGNNNDTTQKLKTKYAEVTLNRSKTMNKEIEEMILAVPQKIVAYDGNPAGQHLYGEQRQEIAEALYNAGYRNTFTSDFASNMKSVLEIEKKNAVKEFAEKLKKKVHNYYPSIDSYCTSKHVILVKDIDELLKEYEK